jgi:natural product biosynthesis luciferase-like monooxygenase protein
MTTERWKCVILGGESLLIECAGTLARHGHRIAAVVTGAAAIQQWAAQQGILAFPNSAALLAAQDLLPFDYLFSITNLSVLPEEVIAMPTRSAINFHDGPLPEYAGLNTPVWALLNGEREHGITWHLMRREVDRGEILAQRRFAIDADETALSLNTKCFEAGVESFEGLVKSLMDGSLRPRAQGGAPQRCYRRRDRPAAAAVLDWTWPAAQIQRLGRALDFGSYANPVASPRTLWADSVLLASAIAATDQSSTLPAGTIVGIDGHALTVATRDFDVRIGALATTCGRPVPLPEAAARHGWAAGVRLPVLQTAAAHAIGELDAAAGPHEPYWTSRLASIQALELPVIDRSAVTTGSSLDHLDVALPEALSTLTSAQCLATVAAWLARVADKASFDIGHADDALRIRIADSPRGLFRNELPLRVQLDFQRDLDVLSAACSDGVAEAHRRGPLLADIVARTPGLRAQAAVRDPSLLPVSVLVLADFGTASVNPATELTIGLREDGKAARWWFDASKIDAAHIGVLQQQWLALACAAAADPSRPLGELPLMGDALRERVLHGWNATQVAVVTQACVHHLIERQTERTPDRTALVAGDRSVSYAELDRRADHLASCLASRGVGPDVLVGLCLPRGIDLVVALVAIHKAGGAYVPLDPAYPADRLAYMLADSKAAVLVTDRAHAGMGGSQAVRTIVLDEIGGAPSHVPRHDGGASPENLAYVIYTSGSTGRPKGVMVEHRNVVNFFAGMDRHLGSATAGTWLAVTSLSFDISVLELVWTLARGFTVVVANEEDRLAAAGAALPAASTKPIDFSLFYFSADEAEHGREKYRLLLEGAKFGDRNGFAAVWTPERHFHAFGGLYPNPAVVGAAIASVTERIGIRAGSVVLPLHHPARVAEEWSVVDNLSNGRVGVSFASGWQPNDFLLKPENYADNKNVMLRGIDLVRRLWRGEAIEFDNPLGQKVATRTLPRPVQKELPYWVTSAGNPQTFVDAGRIGASVLTHLLGQTVEELASKITAYRQAYKEAGHPGDGYVSLMVHTFIGEDIESVRAVVKRPLIEYLKTSLNLVKQYAWTFPAFKRRDGMDAVQGAIDLQGLRSDEMEALLEYSFERYFEGSGLFGTPASCVAKIDRIKAVGVDDVACLVDFGVASETVLAHLPQLARLRELAQPRAATADGGGRSLADLMQRHRVTHLQCTPSLARVLAQDQPSRVGLAKLECMMVGGEAFPPTLARDLAQLVGGSVMNMYGPTETTIWSTVHAVGRDESGVIPLGRPLANQQVHILDSRGQPLPPGVPGELAIGGAGVVRGYFERPELTAERFVPDSIRGVGRLYRTGDLARWRDDGTLEFLGRLDHQVKVRGYRIELGEIEAALAEQPGIAQAVVVAREDAPGDVRLAAYLVTKSEVSIDATALREQLRANLPDFMLPAHYVVLAEFPHTPNGKIDRKSLPAPDSLTAPAMATSEYIVPEGHLEALIVDVWKDVLKLPQVGTRDNFFDLGGHSLLAVQAHRRLREALQRELSITDIFRFPTVRSLAAYLSGGSAGGAQQGVERAQGRRAALQRRQQLRAGAKV